MKKAFLVFIFVIIVNATVFSQNVENKNVDRKFTFQTSPLLFFPGLISFGIGDETFTFFIMDLESQYKINDIFNMSFTVSFFITTQTTSLYYDYSIYDSEDYKEKNFQISFKPMFVYRPSRTGLKGFYLGFYPNIGWQSVKNEIHGDKFWTEIGIGFNTGYKWVFTNGFTLQLGAGIGKTWSIPEKSEGPVYPNSDGRLTLKNLDIHILDFKLGYSF
jgi:hypothetical protein